MEGPTAGAHRRLLHNGRAARHPRTLVNDGLLIAVARFVEAVLLLVGVSVEGTKDLDSVSVFAPERQRLRSLPFAAFVGDLLLGRSGMCGEECQTRNQESESDETHGDGSGRCRGCDRKGAWSNVALKKEDE